MICPKWNYPCQVLTDSNFLYKMINIDSWEVLRACAKWSSPETQTLKTEGSGITYIGVLSVGFDCYVLHMSTMFPRIGLLIGFDFFNHIMLGVLCCGWRGTIDISCKVLKGCWFIIRCWRGLWLDKAKKRWRGLDAIPVTSLVPLFWESRPWGFRP